MKSIMDLIKQKFRILYSPKENMNFRAVIFLLCQFISQAMGFILAPILTRLLVPSDYGRASMYVTYLAILTIFVGLQTNFTINNARMDYDGKQLKEYLSSIIGLSLSVYLFIQVLFMVFQIPLSQLLGYEPYLIVLMPLVSIGNFGISYALTLYIREKRALMYMLISLSNAVFSAVLSLILIIITTGDKATAKIIGYSIPSIVIGLLILAIYFVRGKRFYQLAYWKYCLTLSIPMLFASLSGFINTQSDRLMLKSMIGADSVGIYSFAVTMALPLYAIVNALNNTWNPRFFDLYREGNYSLLFKSSKNYLKSYTLLTVGFLLVCPELVGMIATKKYASAVKLVPLLAIVYYLTFLSRFPINFMTYHKKIKNVSTATFISAVVTIILNYFLIPRFNSLGATITAVITGFLIWWLFEYYARHVGVDYRLFDYRLIGLGVVIVLAMTGITYLFLPWWWIRWIIALLSGILLIIHLKKARGIF